MQTDLWTVASSIAGILAVLIALVQLRQERRGSDPRRRLRTWRGRLGAFARYGRAATGAPDLAGVGFLVPRLNLARTVEREILHTGTKALDPVVLSAPGGFGKSVLARLICRQAGIVRKFGTDIYWVSLGRT